MGWTDLAGIVQSATRSVFSEEATYDAPPGGSPVAITAEFDSSALQVELADGVAVQTVGPRLSVLLSELPGDAAEVGATVSVRGVSYVVTEVEPDGHGMALLRMTRT